MLSYGAFVLAASMILGQAEDRAKQDDFTKLRRFLGNWEATDVEAGGRKAQVHVSWKRILGGRFFEEKWMAVADSNKAIAWGIGIFGRDPADKKLKCWEFASTGDIMPLELLEWKGKTSVWDTVVVQANGTPRKGKTTMTFVGKDSYTWELAFETGDPLRAAFKRATPKRDLWPQPTSKMPEGVREQLKDIAWWTGGFSTEGSDAFTGKTSVGQSNCGWTLDGKFLLYDLAFVESDLTVGRYRAIIGVDPSTNKTTGWEFDSTGTVGKYTVSDKGQDIVGKAISPAAGVLGFKGRLTQTANGSQYRATGKLSDGKETSYHGIWKKRLTEK